MTSLEKQRKILERNMRWEDDKVANNKSYTGPNGKTYGPDYYKKSVNYTAKDLENVNKQIKLKNAIKKTTGIDAEKVAETGSKNVGSMVKDLFDKKKKK